MNESNNRSTEFNMSVTREPQAGWTPMVDTWGGGSGFPQNEWYLPFDGSGAHQQ